MTTYQCSECGERAEQGLNEEGGEGALHCPQHPSAVVDSVQTNQPTNRPESILIGYALPLFETLHGPGGLQLELDAFEIDLNDPGQGTPAMVYATGLTLSSSCSSAPFDCACDTGYVDGFELSQTQAAWLNRHSQRVENFIAEWCVELEKRGLTHLPQPAVMPQSLADEDSGDCSKPGCSGRACPHAAEGFEGYVDSCPKHAHQLFMAELREGNIVLVSPRSTRTHGA